MTSKINYVYQSLKNAYSANVDWAKVARAFKKQFAATDNISAADIEKFLNCYYENNKNHFKNDFETIAFVNMEIQSITSTLMKSFKEDLII